MKNNGKYPSIELNCYKNGKGMLLPPEKAHKLLWQSNYGWVCPLDWYKWNIKEFQGHNYIFKRVGKKSVKFAFLLHT